MLKAITAFLILFAFSKPTLAAQNVYWGFVTTGSGTGFLGHGFLLFKNIHDPFLTADVYQYNLDIDLPLKKTNFVVKKQKFYQLLMTYTIIADRSVLLYELNLRTEEINHLLLLLSKDLHNSNFSADYIYGANENCVSRPILLLNQVVTPERRIAYLGHNGTFFAFDSLSRDPFKSLSDPFLNRLPFYIAETFEHHPISKGLVKYYESESIQKAKFLGGAFQDIHKMSLLCKWNPNTEKTMRLFYSLYVKSQKPLSLESFIPLTRSCPASKKYFMASLASLYQAMNFDATDSKAQIYKTESELLR